MVPVDSEGGALGSFHSPGGGSIGGSCLCAGISVLLPLLSVVAVSGVAVATEWCSGPVAVVGGGGAAPSW